MSRDGSVFTPFFFILCRGMRGKGEDKSMEDLVEISVLGDNLTVSDYPNGRKSTPCLEQLGICTEQLKVD